MSESLVAYTILPPVNPLRGLFYWLWSGLASHEQKYFSDHQIPNWFVANLYPEFQHNYIAEYKFETAEVQCQKCKSTLSKSFPHAFVDNDCGDPLEWIGVPGTPADIVSPDVRDLIVRSGLAGCGFDPVQRYDSSGSDRIDAFSIRPFTWLRDGNRYECTRGCSGCGNQDLQCPECYLLYSACPGCNERRRYSTTSSEAIDTVRLSDWKSQDFLAYKRQLIVTGTALLRILESNCFGFTFGEVLVEQAGADAGQIRLAAERSVALEKLLPLVPGGAENNEDVFNSIY